MTDPEGMPPEWLESNYPGAHDTLDQAAFRADATRLRYRVTYDARNRLWNMTETTIRLNQRGKDA